MNVDLNKKLHDLQIISEKCLINDKLNLNISVKAPENPNVREPVSIICVLDISGSMDTEATQGGAVESDGFSRLDLVKHSVNTIINSLNENDVLGIVTFSDQARIDFHPQIMNEAGRAAAGNVSNSMVTEGCTNLWDGIRLGLDLTKDELVSKKNTFVLVLSDGEPNSHPEGGEYAAAEKYIKEHSLSASLSMFGYGYSLDTKLLASLSELGGGCFGYIPDCSMIGTIFVNFLSAALSSYCAKLQISTANVKGISNISENKITSLGPIQYGSTRNFLIEFNETPQTQDLGEIEIFIGKDSRNSRKLALTSVIEGNEEHVKVQKARNKHYKLLERLIEDSKENFESGELMAKEHLKELNNVLKSLKDENEIKFLESIIKDLESDNKNEGQVIIALSSKEFWTKWGVHYFYALKIAHEIELCTNFKDPGLQLYGGELFRFLQSNLDTIFINLPPPIPSIQKYDADGNLKVVDNMADYYDCYGGCIYGECDAQLANGNKIKVKEIKQGDVLLGMNGPVTVKCVIKTEIEDNIDIVRFESGLIITKYHPVHIEGEWKFPIDTAPLVHIKINAYYNFVLEEGTSMIVNGYPCVTLGHGLVEKVVEHEYFGTQAIISDLMRVTGWSQGAITLQKNAFARDPISHKVIGMVH